MKESSSVSDALNKPCHIARELITLVWQIFIINLKTELI